METNLKRRLAFGATALAAAAFGGGAYAATQDSASSSRQAFLNDVAKRLKVTPHDLTAALQGAFFDQLQAAVKAGRLTQAQADQIEQRVRQSGEAPMGGGFPGPGRFGGGGFFGSRAPGALAGPDGPGGPHAGGLASAAKYLGLSASQLRDQLNAGKSLAQVAAARGKSVGGLKDAITAAVRGQLDKALAAKQITSAEEQQILSRISAQLDALVNRGGFGPRFGARGFFAHPGPIGDAPPPGAPAPGLPGPPPAY